MCFYKTFNVTEAIPFLKELKTAIISNFSPGIIFLKKFTFLNLLLTAILPEYLWLVRNVIRNSCDIASI